MCLPFNFREFYYAGLLPRDDRERERKLIELKKLNVPVIVLDTPYRLSKVLNAVKKIYSKNVKTRLFTAGVKVNVESVVHGTTIIPLYTTTRLRMEYKDGVQRVV